MHGNIMPLVPAYVRASGEISASFAATGARTGVERVYEAGGLRLRFPNVARGCEGVCINTGGGILGGDRALYNFTIGEGADVTLTTQAAEKVYRAQQGAAHVEVNLDVAQGAALEWLPQETILFEGASLQRRLNIDLAKGARLALVESVIFGRLAMGEESITGSLQDRWRIRREGRLVYADDFRLDGAMGALLDRPATGRGARAMATLLQISSDAEEALEPARATLEEAGCEWGASAWDGLLCVRMVSPSPEKLRSAIVALLASWRGRDAPRVWN